MKVKEDYINWFHIERKFLTVLLFILEHFRFVFRRLLFSDLLFQRKVSIELQKWPLLDGLTAILALRLHSCKNVLHQRKQSKTADAV